MDGLMSTRLDIGKGIATRFIGTPLANEYWTDPHQDKHYMDRDH